MNTAQEGRQPEATAQQTAHDAEFARVLIVNDDPAVLWSADQALRRAGYRTATAFDGQGALHADRRHGPFDLLITDLYMPFMNGIEIARRLRRRTPRLKALYLMASGDQIFPIVAASQRDERFIHKVGDIYDLLAAVESLLHAEPPPSGGVS
jgi:CheY-like chemotaxis protein